MPYKNVVFIKLLWKEILHDDDRFTDQLDDSQKGLYLMLLLLAGATTNNIKNDENYIKRVLNIQEKPENIRKNIDKICLIYPKLSKVNGFLKFKNFKKIHNYLRSAEGLPKDSPRIDKNRIDKIRIEYIRIRGLDINNFSSDDFNRTAKAIKTLLVKSGFKDDLVVKGIEWAAKQSWCDWTLETIIRRWPDYMKNYKPKYEPKPSPTCDICQGKGLIPEGPQKGATCLCVK